MRDSISTAAVAAKEVNYSNLLSFDSFEEITAKTTVHSTLLTVKVGSFLPKIFYVFWGFFMFLGKIFEVISL